MNVYLMRHATAVEAGGASDPLRALSPAGEREARETGRLLREMGVSLREVRTSPLLRARQTAEAVARELKAPVRVVDALTSGASLEDYWEEIRREGSEGCLFVGHNPEIGTFVSRIAGMAIAFRPATLCRLDLQDTGNRVGWVRHP